MTFDRAVYQLDESRYPAGVRVISGGSRATREPLFEEEVAKAYLAGWTCIRTDGSKNLLKPAILALQEENSIAFFVEELTYDGVSAFELMLKIVTAAITPERHVSIVVSGEEWITRLVKESPASPVLTQSVAFIDGESQPSSSERGENRRHATSRFITGGSSEARAEALHMDTRISLDFDDWKFFHIPGSAQVNWLIDDVLATGEPVAVLVEELQPDHLESAIMALTEIANANSQGAKITLSISGERSEIETLLAEEDAQLLGALELVDLDQHQD